MTSVVALHPTEFLRVTKLCHLMDSSQGIEITSSGEATPLLASLDDSNDATDSAAQIIEEAKNILLRRASYQELDRSNDMGGHVPFPLADYSQSAKTLIASQLRNEIPSQTPTKASVRRKAVKFDLKLNTTYEYETVRIRESVSSSESDSDTDLGSSDFGSVGDASDLVAIDDEVGSTESRVRVAFANDVTYIESSEIDEDKEKSITVNSDEDSKQQLKEDIAELRKEYEEELVKLRRDYESRREDYMTELEEINDEVAKRRLLAGKDVSDSTSEGSFEAKLEILKQEKEEIKEFEEMLKCRKEYCLEQQQQVDEYEKYLDRRHESLTDKEEDLKTLQDELQEFSVALRRREKELRERSNQLSSEEEPMSTSCDCEITRDNLQAKIDELSEKLHESETDLDQVKRERNDLNERMSLGECERRLLQTKVLQLEDQLSLQLRISTKDMRKSPDPHRHANGNVATTNLQTSQSSQDGDEAVEEGRRPMSRTCAMM